MTKKIIAKNIVRDLIYKFANKVNATNLDNDDISSHTFVKGESFEVDAEHLEKLKVLFPHEIVVEDGVYSSNVVKQKDEQIVALMEENKKLKASKKKDKTESETTSEDVKEPVSEEPVEENK